MCIIGRSGRLQICDTMSEVLYASVSWDLLIYCCVCRALVPICIDVAYTDIINIGKESLGTNILTVGIPALTVVSLVFFAPDPIRPVTPTAGF